MVVGIGRAPEVMGKTYAAVAAAWAHTRAACWAVGLWWCLRAAGCGSQHYTKAAAVWAFHCQTFECACLFMGKCARVPAYAHVLCVQSSS